MVWCVCVNTSSSWWLSTELNYQWQEMHLDLVYYFGLAQSAFLIDQA